MNGSYILSVVGADIVTYTLIVLHLISYYYCLFRGRSIRSENEINSYYRIKIIKTINMCGAILSVLIFIAGFYVNQEILILMFYMVNILSYIRYICYNFIMLRYYGEDYWSLLFGCYLLSRNLVIYGPFFGPFIFRHLLCSLYIFLLNFRHIPIYNVKIIEYN